jgi:hypothetical protein
MSIDCSFIREGNVTILAFKSASAATAATAAATATAVTSIVVTMHYNRHSFHYS